MPAPAGDPRTGDLAARVRRLEDLHAIQQLRAHYCQAHDRTTGTTGLVVAGLTVMVTAPLAGIASDRSGRRPVLLAGAVWAAAFSFPFFVWPVGAYVVALATITFVAAWLAPETYRRDLSDTPVR